LGKNQDKKKINISIVLLSLIRILMSQAYILTALFPVPGFFFDEMETCLLRNKQKDIALLSPTAK